MDLELGQQQRLRARLQRPDTPSLCPPPPGSDGDGYIYPWDTYVGFRKLGFNVIISALAAPFIHGSFSYPSQVGALACWGLHHFSLPPKLPHLPPRASSGWSTQGSTQVRGGVKV